MKHKKEVYYLEDPAPDPFLVSSDLEVDQLRKYHYLENEAYKRYKRSERLHFIAIIVICLFLAGLAYFLITVPAETIDNLFM